jgi:hypothetical protein
LLEQTEMRPTARVWTISQQAQSEDGNHAQIRLFNQAPAVAALAHAVAAPCGPQNSQKVGVASSSNTAAVRKERQQWWLLRPMLELLLLQQLNALHVVQAAADQSCIAALIHTTTK